jgi:hypothetical protein
LPQAEDLEEMMHNSSEYAAGVGWAICAQKTSSKK